MIHGATPGNDQRFGAAKLEHARNFANKLWNATRFVVGARPVTIPAERRAAAPGCRHLGRPSAGCCRAPRPRSAVDAAMADYAFGEVTRLLYDAIWSEYCDWGLELAKVRLADESPGVEAREATWWTLVEVLDTYLRLLHPVMPFVTEALWAALPHRATDPGLLIVARWPAAGERDEATEGQVEALIGLVGAIRNARPEARSGARDLAAGRARRAGRDGPNLRGAPPRNRPPGSGAAARAPPDSRGPGGRGRAVRPRGHCRRARGARPTSGRRGGGPAIPPPSSAHGSSASWPMPRAGWQRRASAWPTTRSLPERRLRSSRAPGPARPSWPTRSRACDAASATEGPRPRPGLPPR